jgi:hypothetical protein
MTDMMDEFFVTDENQQAIKEEQVRLAQQPDSLESQGGTVDSASETQVNKNFNDEYNVINITDEARELLDEMLEEDLSASRKKTLEKFNEVWVKLAEGRDVIKEGLKLCAYTLTEHQKNLFILSHPDIIDFEIVLNQFCKLNREYKIKGDQPVKEERVFSQNGWLLTTFELEVSKKQASDD